ncbi:hypothetical protein LCGC14_2607660 [marine sediment metagenome]|uniref:Uncharacterized protein n=1 Tax=marine sediment metagenome TaxID=412755 RepID=A0A0F9CHX5_9ZZZZ
MATQKELIQEVHQAVLGVEGTDDKGLVGDLKELKTDVKAQNGRVGRNTLKIAGIIAFLAGLGVLGGLEISDVIHLLGS